MENADDGTDKRKSISASQTSQAPDKRQQSARQSPEASNGQTDAASEPYPSDSTKSEPPKEETVPYFDPGPDNKTASSVFTSIAITQNDDPWAADLDDRLGANEEAKAFARLAVAKDFIPPLAIGLFGDWGSGKSFFMRLIYQHIERLCRGKPSIEAPESGSEAFHTDVVQIRFNAWHYVETNLWASLVSHLFTELDRWYDKHNPQASDPLLEHLSTSRMLTLEAAQELVRRRHEQRVASEQLLLAQKELEAVQARTASSPSVYFDAVTKVLGKTEDNKPTQTVSDFKAAAEVLGIDAVAKSAREFQQVSSALQSEVRRGQLLASGYKFQLLSWFNVSVFVIFVLALPWLAKEGMDLLSAKLPDLGELQKDFVLLSVTVTAVTARLRWILKTVRSALTDLQTAKGALDEAIKTQLTQQENAFKAAQEELAKVNASVDEAKALVQTTSARLALAAHDYSQGTGAGRLKKFVRARATDGDYAQHLSLIATVRKDFEELAFNVAEAGSLRESVEAEREAFILKMDAFLAANQSLLEAEDVTKLRAASKHSPDKVRSFKRIALYIDDLDRCPPEKVVDVLQAVHLLLTFPLFVVMVAVDVRWVRKALLSHYPSLMTEGRGQQQTASVSDYLEKIFQIPYWVRPMDGATSEQFLRSQLDRIKRATAKRASGGKGKVAPGVEVVFVQDTATRTLKISRGETDALQRLAPYIGTSPRRALRFLNVYRLIKVSFNSTELNVLGRGDYKLLLTLLAIAMGAPLSFSKLQSIKDDGLPFTMESLRGMATQRAKDEDRSELDRLSDILALYYGPEEESKTDIRRKLKKYISIVQRYSFVG
jgi:hypothetical protein